jgi:hypothetical protein
MDQVVQRVTMAKGIRLGESRVPRRPRPRACGLRQAHIEASATRSYH